MESKREADGSPLQRLDFAGFAQEFLRRNPRYRAEYLNLIPRQNRENADAGQEVMARRWGLCFPLCTSHTRL